MSLVTIFGGRGAAVVNSGLTVANSVPGVIQPTTLARAGLKPDARRPLDHAKSWQGFGDGVPKQEASYEAAPRSSFLDEIEINRNKPQGRGKHCGSFTIRGFDAKSGTTKFYRLNCKCWRCSYCGPRKAKRYRRAIADTAERLRLCRFLTLTLDPKKIQGDPVRYLNRVWAKLRTYLKRRFGATPAYIRILEFQQSGYPHLHILVDRFIVHSWLQQAWQSVGGGLFVNIKWVDVHRVSRYLSKYLTKELLLSAPLRSRRVTTSRGIHLLEAPPQETSWELIRFPILLLFDLHRAHVTSFECDEDRVLMSFSMSN